MASLAGAVVARDVDALRGVEEHPRAHETVQGHAPDAEVGRLGRGHVPLSVGQIENFFHALSCRHVSSIPVTRITTCGQPAPALTVVHTSLADLLGFAASPAPTRGLVTSERLPHARG